MQERSLILDDHQVNLRLHRMAWEILELAGDPCDLVVAGIQGMGHVLAEQLADRIERSEYNCLFADAHRIGQTGEGGRSIHSESAFG